jgi:hypothetical protein
LQPPVTKLYRKVGNPGLGGIPAMREKANENRKKKQVNKFKNNLFHNISPLRFKKKAAAQLRLPFWKKTGYNFN